MEEPFELSVYYKDLELYFTAGFLRPERFRIQVAVILDSVELLFEPDNEGHYKVVGEEAFTDKQFPERGLITAICQRLDYLFKPGHRKKLDEQEGLEG